MKSMFSDQKYKITMGSYVLERNRSKNTRIDEMGENYFDPEKPPLKGNHIQLLYYGYDVINPNPID